MEKVGFPGNEGIFHCASFAGPISNAGEFSVFHCTRAKSFTLQQMTAMLNTEWILPSLFADDFDSLKGISVMVLLRSMERLGKVLLLAGVVSQPIAAEEYRQDRLGNANCDLAGDCCDSLSCDERGGLFTNARGGKPTWSFYGGAILMKRSDANSSPIFTENGILPNQPVILRGSDFDFDPGWGFEVGGRKKLDSCYSLDGRFFSVSDNTASDNLDVTSGYQLVSQANANAGILDGFNNANIASRFDSDVLSTEINLRRHVRERLDIFAGFRYVELDEMLAMTVNDLVSKQFAFETDNSLFGSQLGLDWIVVSTDRFTTNVLAKSGIYTNDAENSASAAGPLNTISAADDRNQVAFVGELSFVNHLAVTRSLSAYAGYHLMWLDGVAVASSQAQATTFDNNAADGFGIDTSDSVMFQSFAFGGAFTF